MRLIRRGAGLGLESRHHQPEYDGIVMGHFCYDVCAVSQYVRTLPPWDIVPALILDSRVLCNQQLNERTQQRFALDCRHEAL